MTSLKARIGEALWQAAAAGPPGARYLAWFDPLPVLAEREETPLLGVMAALWMLSPELQNEFDLDSRKERARFIGWCCTIAAKDFAILRETAVFGPAREIYFRPSGYVAHFSGGPVAVPFAITSIFGLEAPDRAFDATQAESLARALLGWYFEKLDELFGGPDSLPSWFVEALHRAGPDLRQFPLPPSSPPAPVPEGECRKGGVNVFGHLHAQLGVGEDVRCGSAALAAAGVPHVLLETAVGSDVSQTRCAFDAAIVAAPVFDLNILFMTAIETLRLFCTRGAGVFLGRRTIGVWPWELPQWPRELAFCYFLVDEVWAISEFVRKSYELSSPVPVVWMPPAMLVPPVAPDRAKFGLPPDDYLFLVSFDGLSSYNRKNPFAAIRAFRAAFPAQGDKTRLVVKTMRGMANAEHREELEMLVAGDPNIILIDRDFSRGDTLALIASCDCYVSLHRSEGLGRILAEAVILGRPVVATYWSGNVDFADLGAQYLIESNTVALKPGDYPNGDGQVWAEPDFAAAVEALRAARAEAFRGRHEIPERFRPDHVGARYARRLRIHGVAGNQ